MRHTYRLLGLLSAFSFLLASPAIADVKLPAVIGSNMVLQQEADLTIWGTADAGEVVTVAISSQKASATADAQGRWSVRLQPLSAGGPYELTVAGRNKLTLKNVLVGEVWIASGQSNMQWSVRQSADPDEEIAQAKYPKIRLFAVARKPAEQPQHDCQGEWVECSPGAVADFSAVAYYFGRDIHKMRGVPVGLINTSYGGTPAESWTSRSALEAYPEFKLILDRRQQAYIDYPK